MAKINLKSKKTWKKIILITMSCLLLFGAIFGIVRLFSETSPTDTKTISHNVFSIGGLNDDGTYLETDASIYTKDAIECQGLKITPNFENNINYQVFFYDYDGEFVSANDITDDKTTSAPRLARYCRVVITPKDDAKISWYEVDKYAKQLTIEVYEEQNFTNPTEINYFGVDAEKLNYMVANTNTVGSALTLTESSAIGTLGCSKMVNVDGTNKVIVKAYSGNFDAWRYAFVDSSNNVVAVNSMTADDIVDGVAIMELQVPAGATQFTFTYRQGNSYGIYLA